MSDFLVKQGGQLSFLQTGIKDNYGNTVDLTNSTVNFRYRNRFETSGASFFTGSVNITNASAGLVSFSGLNTTTGTVYFGEFLVINNSGQNLIYPADRYFTIEVVERV